ncbi:endonuclease/exonuclease/phosphatase family protein [Enterovirga aerilata]|uniref:endonuclease/exonuclease/phosphatase family protein n=1 Tax=Enterovirga aerilata TaxID=2730920 RepID=UPI0015819B61|nr:endonuclease/exonuclease/phosphatase family protein [Enterovirga sp. DB1703]
MVQYSSIKSWTDAPARDRTIDRLLALRAGLDAHVTAKTKQSSFHLATWNIRDLGSNKFNPSPRTPEAFLYIAEIISAFDLVAIQEVNRNLTDFETVMRLLGPHWTYILTDQSGNNERLAFVYDTRKILFRHIAGEIVLPDDRGKKPDQFNRTPFLVAFQAGWFKFNLCTVHIYYGTATDTARRQQEIKEVAEFFAKRQKADGETYILLGDFNILSPDDPLMGALLGGGFTVPAELRKPTGLASANFYDQIAMRTQQKLAEIAAAGSFPWNEYVFRDDDPDYTAYRPLMPTTTKGGKPAKTDKAAYRKWRTWQMSDHLPLWTEIKVDFTEAYLDSLRAGKAPLATFAPTSGPRPAARRIAPG